MVAKELQNVIENYSINEPVGACYLFGHCLNNIFKKLGYQSREVTGKLAILLNKGKGKYISYGKLKKCIQIGEYHTWCEIDFEGKKHIVDPSLKYNLKFLRRVGGYKVHGMVEKDLLVTGASNNYYIRYYEDASLKSLSRKTLKKLTSSKMRNQIVQTTIEHLKIRYTKEAA